MFVMTRHSNHQRVPVQRGGVNRVARGFTMVEVLVSMLILAIGLLGLAGLQASGLRYSGNSALRTQALLLSQDISERMRANPTGVSASNYEVTTLPTSYTTDCGAATCTPAALATYDLVKWKNTIDSRLPAGASATIDVAPDSPSAGITTVVITLTWDDRTTEGGGGANQSLISTLQL
ncbi:MAG: type IV pilus modification protein PilV [Sulfuricaulis sp.]